MTAHPTVPDDDGRAQSAITNFDTQHASATDRRRRMNTTTQDTRVRELDCRSSDGIEVRLLWREPTAQVWVSVADTRSGTSFEFPVAAADALEAFHHPYAFATGDLKVGAGVTLGIDEEFEWPRTPPTADSPPGW
jgi:hypothetical protein